MRLSIRLLTAAAATTAALAGCSGAAEEGAPPAPAETAAASPSSGSGGPSSGSSGGSEGAGLSEPRDPDAEARVEAMDKLEPMIGEWEGPATVMSPDGPVELTQHEMVERKLSGDMITVQGTGRAEDGTVQFTAFAIVTYDLESQQYTWRAYSDQAQGHVLETELRVQDNGDWEWTQPTPQGEIVNSTTFADGNWAETGTMTMSDGREVETLSMNLTKIG